MGGVIETIPLKLPMLAPVGSKSGYDEKSVRRHQNTALIAWGFRPKPQLTVTTLTGPLRRRTVTPTSMA